MAKQPTKSPTASLSPTLQRFFVGSVGFMFVMQIVQNCYYISQQYRDNENLSSFMGWFIGTAIAALLWFVVYLTRRNRTLNLRTIFDVTLVTVTTIMVTISLGWIVSFVQLPFAKDMYDIQWYVALYQALPFIVAVPLLVIVIRRLRAAKQW